MFFRELNKHDIYMALKDVGSELTFRKTGGFRNTPTPGGVPVRNTSPGYSVRNLRS